MNSRVILTNGLQPESVLVTPERSLPLGADSTSVAPCNEQVVLEYSQWLSFHRLWGQLPAQILTAIAQSLQCFRVEPQTLIYQEGQKNIGLYLLKWGAVEIARLSLIGKSLIRYRSDGELFGYVSLRQSNRPCN